MKRFSLLLAAFVGVWSAASADAAVFSISADLADYEPQNVGAVSNGVSGALRVGTRTLDPAATTVSAIFPFALPTIPAGEEVTSAQLSVLTQVSSLAPVANADLYALAVDAGPTVDQNGAYYFSGPDDTTAGVTKLQDNYLVPANAAVAQRFVSVDFGTYIAGLYAAGAQPGDFVTLRLSYDISTIDTTAHNRYLIRSRQASASVENPVDQHPLLLITTSPIPEPTGLSLIGLGGLGLLARRRR